MKYLGKLSIAVAAFLFLGFGAVFAASGSATNDTTGACSENEVKLRINSIFDLDVDNDADIDNKGFVFASTGDNESSYNTGSGKVETGDIDVALDIANLIGFSGWELEGLGGMFDWDITAGNDTTGFNSENKAKVKIDNKVEIDVDNDTSLDNKVKAWINTGNNESSYNTGSGTVSTGDASFEGEWKNSVNYGMVFPELNFGAGGSIEVSNSTTGASSENEARVEVRNKVEVDVDNRVNVDNAFCLNANTGNNESSYNTGNGSVRTGDVSGSVNFTNTVR